MPLSEFNIIEYFFKRGKNQRKDVLLGIGDDAALLKIPAKQVLAISMDTLVAGIHFPKNTKPYDIGYKSLAVNLSDMAAMGATPAWVSLALTLPHANKSWLKKFAAGFFNLIEQYQLQLVGGDMTRGEQLTITAQMHGFVPINKALTRQGAKPGDKIYVTGTLGDAGLVLQLLRQPEYKIPSALLNRLNRPTPRVLEGLALRNIATSAIDISDGLSGDLTHILKASHVGATLWVDEIPISNNVAKLINAHKAIELALSSGDDYELCFTVPANKEKQLLKALAHHPCGIRCIGTIEKQQGLRLRYNNGKRFLTNKKSFQHFQD